jgi:hypothetical protein
VNEFGAGIAQDENQEQEMRREATNSLIFCFPATGVSRPLGIRQVKAPNFLNFRHYEGGMVVTITQRPSLPPGGFWYSFLEIESTPGHMVPSVASEKIPSDTNEDRSRDPPISSAVP